MAEELSDIQEWLKELSDEVVGIFHHLDLFKKLRDIIENNEKLQKADQMVLSWMGKAFTVDLVMAIGRVCDTKRGTKSLTQLLQGLKKRSEYLERNRYIRFYNGTVVSDLADKHFDGLAGEGQQTYAKSKIEGDIIQLTKEDPCRKILAFRNQYVAHFSKHQDPPPGYSELLGAFEVIEKIMKKYNVLIRGSCFLGLTPTIQTDWQEPFTFPWISEQGQDD